MINMTTLTAAEKAYVESGGQGNPYPDEKVETETTNEPPAPEPDKQSTEAAKPEDAEKPEAETEESDEGEEVEVVNKEGETRRKMIAYGAYEKQRKAAHAAKEEMSKLQQQMAYLQGVLQNMRPGEQPQAQTAQPSPATPPDYRKEPEKWLEWVNGLGQRVQQSTEQQTQATQQQAQFQQLNDAVYQAEQEFVTGDGTEGSGHADFYDAVKFLNEARKADMKEAGYSAQEIQQILAAQSQDVALRALRQGKSPAAVVYQLAKQRGFKAPKPTPPKETEAEKIARQAKNQEKAGKTISGLSGGEAKELTVEALANMDPKAFEKLWKTGKVDEMLGSTKSGIWG